MPIPFSTDFDRDFNRFDPYEGKEPWNKEDREPVEQHEDEGEIALFLYLESQITTINR